MAIFRLKARAKADLKAIGRYTEKRWGHQQRNLYLAQLDACFYRPADAPQRGHRSRYLHTDYYQYTIGRHVIFYRITEQGIDIIRILHDRMDIQAHLENET